MMTDPIADMLTRIRNGLMSRKQAVDVRGSKMNQGIARVLKDEGYIADYKVMDLPPQGMVRVYLKYGPDGEDIVQKLSRASKPSRRVYCGVDEIPTVMGGLGIVVLSTPKGILSDRECRRERVGGEVICTVS
ncbi:30S ribosomal protein S8 [bacterium]|nr:30S ribosomal protein S8 [bacterium]